MFHEVGHALGIVCALDGDRFYAIGDNDFAFHVYDQRGVKAQENQQIVKELPAGMMKAYFMWKISIVLF